MHLTSTAGFQNINFDTVNKSQLVMLYFNYLYVFVLWRKYFIMICSHCHKIFITPFLSTCVLPLIWVRGSYCSLSVFSFPCHFCFLPCFCRLSLIYEFRSCLATFWLPSFFSLTQSFN